MRKKYFGDRAFYKMALTVSIPMMLQNFITNFVSLLDNFMVGAVGTEEMTAVSIINQILFVFNLVVFGALSGAGIFTAQYHGKKDEDGIRSTLRFKVGIGILLTVLAVGMLILLDDQFIGLFIHDVDPHVDVEQTIRFSKEYLKIVLWGLAPFALASALSSTLRETEETLVPMLMGLAAVVTNCLFNYLLIFGKFGFPELGVRGAAIATVLSRYVEFGLLAVYCIKKRDRFRYFHGAFKSLRIPPAVMGQIARKGLPLLFNEFFWSSGIALIGSGYSLHGLSVVAGYSISSTVVNLFTIAFISFGSAIGIIIGKQLGANEFDQAVDSCRKLSVFAVLMSLGITLIVLTVGYKVPMLYNTTVQSKDYAMYFIRVSALFFPFTAYANASYFTLRSGGKTGITIIYDSVFMMTISVPAVYLLYYAAHLDIWKVYAIIQSLEILKCLIGFAFLRSGIWVRNIVSTEPQGEQESCIS